MSEESLKQKNCSYCGKVLHGRSDQRFCNDGCRNNFNRDKRKADRITEHENTPEILRIIRHNYQLLKSHCPKPLEENTFIRLNRAALIEKGFNPKFFTSIFKDDTGSEWNCVLEIGYLLGAEEVYIRDFPQQMQL
ncbi:hypothetical protein [Pedobacter aquatilis]|uniref:hypothetical protein n=1 Tax=Pedobacter aquatilis TaxID=351343 RepID=UPI00292F8D3B|nr:hypothetical protein [Pedobacter aquatilis]